jgi:CheY-like chemotaxis protein
VSAPKKLALLIVEDDAQIRHLAERAAAQCGDFNRIYTAVDGAAALAIVWHELRERGNAGTPPDLVLTDLSMPNFDGIALIREMKSREETRGIPIAMMTSSNRPNDREDAMAAGCCTFFEKPIRYSDFVALIGSLPDRCLQPVG